MTKSLTGQVGVQQEKGAQSAVLPSEPNLSEEERTRSNKRLLRQLYTRELREMTKERDKCLQEKYRALKQQYEGYKTTIRSVMGGNDSDSALDDDDVGISPQPHKQTQLNGRDTALGDKRARNRLSAKAYRDRKRGKKELLCKAILNLERIIPLLAAEVADLITRTVGTSETGSQDGILIQREGIEEANPLDASTPTRSGDDFSCTEYTLLFMSGFGPSASAEFVNEINCPAAAVTHGVAPSGLDLETWEDRPMHPPVW